MAFVALLLAAGAVSAESATWGCFVCEVYPSYQGVYNDRCVQVASGQTGTGIYCRTVNLGDGVTVCRNSGSYCTYIVVTPDPINHGVARFSGGAKKPQKIAHIF